jgi:hypothetical protein
MNQGDKRTIAQDLKDIETKASQANEGTVASNTQATGSTKARREEERKLTEEYRRQLILNETQFRQDKLSQDQALKNLNIIEQEAIERGILTDETLRGVNAQRQLFLSQSRIQNNFVGMAMESKRANLALINLGRIVQDLPFGFLGISNNIDPALSSLEQLRNESGGTGGALRALLGSLKGPGGIIFALGSLLPSAILISQSGFNRFAKSTKDAKTDVDKLIESISDLRKGDGFSFLSKSALEAEKESIESLSFITDEILEFNKQANLPLADRDVVNRAKAELKRLEEIWGITAEEAEKLVKRVSQIDKQIESLDARRATSSLGLFKEEIESTAKQTIKLADTNPKLANSVKELAEDYFSQAAALKDSIGEDKEKQLMFDILIEQARELDSTYEGYANAISDVNDETRDLSQTSKDLAESYKIQEREAKVAQQALLDLYKLIQNPPKEQEANTVREERELQSALLLQDLKKQNIVNAERGLKRELLQIDLDYERQAYDLAFNGLLNADILRQLEIAKEAEKEDAITAKEQEEAKKRQDIRRQLFDTAIGLASGYIGALSQLNATQTDETEQQARAKFESQKKLSKAQAIVDGAAGINRQFRDLPLFAAIPAAAVVAATTALQLRAINATQFNSSSFRGNSTSTSGVAKRGFFTTDSGSTENRPRRPDTVQPLIINLKGDISSEMVSIKAEQGAKARRRGAIFIASSQ